MVRIPDKAKHTNPNGTINGVTYMAELSGLDPREIKWMWDRMRHLTHVEKRTMVDAKAILKTEAADKPWLST
jgi:hypothetical protein